MASALSAVVFGVPWWPGLTHWPNHRSVSHPLVSLIVVTGILVLVAWTFRRRTN